ncbi:GNAT family N-acetyltransferase [Knoellia sp. S7-12]|uniref:GNAT family N-acetyltransferase n=1 Tax=Knoellia sp. S7-12 TaxID=3126698 RepID=UPI00336894AA
MTATFEFHVDSHLDDHWSAYLGGLVLRHVGDGTSMLTGVVADQSQLHGVLAGLRDVGAPLLAVRMVEEESNPLAGLAWPKRTERLALRPARAEDAEATWQFRRLDSVGSWQTYGPMELEAYQSRFCEPDRLGVTLVIELEGEVIGDLMLRVEDGWAQKEVVDEARGTQAELAWTLDPAYEGHGYATEAVRELIRICFAELGVRRIVATCFADNEASWRLMERVGMRRELHAVRDALHRSGEWLDTYGYALLGGAAPNGE